MVDMRINFKSKRNVFALFAGHLAIEKMLKGLCAAKQVTIVREHKLLILANNASLNLTTIQQSELLSITAFNINARYDDFKLKFHQLCTPQYTKLWVSKIEAWYKYLKLLVIQERSKLPNNTPT
jgi:HEPN domain-containing protein